MKAMALVDVHHHIIHGLDDGSPDFDETKRMLLRARAEGIEHIIATPHAYPGHREFQMETFLKRLEMANSWCKTNKIDLCIHPGSEILYLPDTLRMLREGRIPTLAGSSHVMLEFPPDSGYHMLKEAARKLQNSGYQPVFAHVERYRCLRNLGNMEELHDKYQVLMQMNANTVISKQGFFGELWKKHVFAEGWIDIVSSDAHNTTSRPCKLGKAYHWLADHYDGELADWLCCGAATEILNDAR